MMWEGCFKRTQSVLLSLKYSAHSHPTFWSPCLCRRSSICCKGWCHRCFCALPELPKCSPADAADLCQGSGCFASVWEPVSRRDQSLLKVNLRGEEWHLLCKARSDREKSHVTGGNFPQCTLRPLALHGPKASGLSGDPQILPDALQHLCCAQEVEGGISV